MNEISTIETGVTLSDSAVRRLAALSQREGKQLMLRLAVLGGGCQGYKYKFDFADQAEPEDKVYERDGVRLLVDNISLDYIRGGEVNFVETMMGSYFEVRNPNAATSCGCGTSFSVA